MWYFLLFAALLGADQLIKYWTVEHLALGESAAFWPGVMRLTRVHNYGAAWSSFSGQTAALAVVTVLLMAAVAYLLVRRIVRHPLGVIAGLMILAGGVGNLIDRLFRGYVVDMFHFQFWPSYPVFNVADICIVTGAVLGVIYYLWIYERFDQKRSEHHGDGDPAGQ